MSDKSRSNDKKGNKYHQLVRPVSPEPLSPSTTEIIEHNERWVKRLRKAVYVLLVLYMIGLVSIPIVLALD